MYKKISFYIQIAILLVLVKSSLQAQAFNFVYIDSCYTEPYNNGHGTILSWIAEESDLLEYYIIERSTDLFNWEQVTTRNKNNVINMSNKNVVYRWLDNIASHKLETIYWYRVRAISTIGEFIYDTPPIPNQLINTSSANPYVFDNRIIKFFFFNDFFQKGSMVSLVNIITNQTYTFEEPLKKGMQALSIPKKWHISKGTYILKLSYELSTGIHYHYHIVHLL